MSEERTSGIWFILILGILATIALFIFGILFLAIPDTMIALSNQLGISSILNAIPILNGVLGVNIFGEPLRSTFPLLGVGFIIYAIVILIDFYGFWTFKGWAWTLTVLISLALIVLVIGIILLYILFKEDTKMAFGKM